MKTSVRERLLASTIICGALAAFAAPATAQEQPAGLGVPQQSAPMDEATEVGEVVVTGSRIRVPGLVSASPITSVGETEIRLQQQPEIERVLRNLPAVQTQDNAATNNGTEGAATISLRGLGPQRNLILIDGKRVTPYDDDGIVDTSTIPTALIERVDVITGGASAVYGSDAVSGAINFILKNDFEGVELTSDYSLTEEGDGDIYSAALTFGSNMADGRGNAVANLFYSNRQGVLLGARPLGNVGIVTATAGGLEGFLAGRGPEEAPAGCQGPGAVSLASGGSGTTLPTRVAIAGAGAVGQFRDDGSIGANCSVFNFNPFNYYQTPQERFGATALARYEITDWAEAYARFSFSSTNVQQQVAASGIFGNLYFVPLQNPFLTASARNTLITAANARRTSATPTVIAGQNWRDLNNNGVVDAADDLQLQVNRRTVELGARSTEYDQNYFQMVFGLRGEVGEDWSYDVSFQHGESDRNERSDGYTNTANFGEALNAVSTTACRNTAAAGCVPVNIFGGFGTISDAAAQYVGASAQIAKNYAQTVGTASVSGSLRFLQSPLASIPVAVSFGAEYRKEEGEVLPDLCWQLAPASCLGGAGGNILPIRGEFDVYELFGESIIPLVNDRPFFESLDLELGYRFSDYNISGTTNTWKAGVNWQPTEQLRLRVMQQRAARAPTIGELFAPITATLDNATADPCAAQQNGNPRTITGQLRTQCILSGQTAAQVGIVQDLVSGQINTFSGSDPNNLADVELADTTTIGGVWSPTFLPAMFASPTISLDYYKIEIEDYIDELSPQEVLDACYVELNAGACANIVRIAGGLTAPGSGVRTLTTNFDRLTAEGYELAANVGLDLEDVGLSPAFGSLQISFNANVYTQLERTSAQRRLGTTGAVLDCLGYFGQSCGEVTVGPFPEYRHVQRTTWDLGKLQLSYLWRHFGEVSTEPGSEPNVDPRFRKIDSFDWIDLAASFDINDNVVIRGSVTNVFDEDPPIVGNEAGTTDANSGNTFPGAYDTLGRVFSVGVNLRF